MKNQYKEMPEEDPTLNHYILKRQQSKSPASATQQNNKKSKKIQRIKNKSTRFLIKTINTKI